MFLDFLTFKNFVFFFALIFQPRSVLALHCVALDGVTGLREAMEASYSTVLVPGGSAQNTARVVQWLFGVPRCTTVLACIGNDSIGRQLAR